MCRAVQAKQEQERHGAEVHKEAESDDEAEEGKGAESKTDDASQQAAPAVADDAADEELDAELLAALGGQKSLPQGIMSEDELNRMVRCWIACCGCDRVTVGRSATARLGCWYCCLLVTSFSAAWFCCCPVLVSTGGHSLRVCVCVVVWLQP